VIYVDIDGVLVNSFPRAYIATRRALEDLCNYELSEKRFVHSFWGQDWKTAINNINQVRFMYGMEEIDDVLAARIKDYKDAMLIADPWDVCPIAEAFVCSLDKPLTLCTAGSEMGARSKIHGWPYFESLPLIHSARKRNPDFWTRLQGDATLVVDDDDEVIKAAESAFIPTIHWRIHRRAP